MQKVIEQITDHLVSLVTSDKAVYTLKMLNKAGIPSFVVERIRLTVEDKVRDEIDRSEAIWFNANARIVKQAFDSYIQAAVSSSQIPSDQLYPIVHTVIQDIIYVFIEPRKKMAEYIYREDDELSLKEIELRCDRLTIYKHFATAIPLYMKKRTLDVLTKERCSLLIQKLDAKLVASYTAQDWAQKLEELFVLFGGKVEPLLLTTYFEDKGLYGMSGKFEGLKSRITKTDFIQILSSDRFNSSEPKESNSTAEDTDPTIKKNDPEKSLMEKFFGNYEYVPVQGVNEEETIAGAYTESSLSEDEMSELLSDIANEGVIGVDDFTQVDSLNKLFSLRNQDDGENQISETTEEIAAKMKVQKEDESEEIVEFRENLISILDQAKHSFENIDQKEEVSADENIVDIFEEENETEVLVEEENTLTDDVDHDNEADEKPIWAQFLSKDQMEVMMGGDRNKIVEDETSVDDEETIGEESIFSDDVFMDDEQFISSPNNALEEILEDRKVEFIDIIFNGSENSFRETLQIIDRFENWKETSSFIQQEVFTKNEVDLFSGATVDFTDRLHRYFNDQRNS